MTKYDVGSRPSATVTTHAIGRGLRRDSSTTA